MNLQTRGEGVKKSEHFADVICVSPLILSEELLLPLAAVLHRLLGGASPSPHDFAASNFPSTMISSSSTEFETPWTGVILLGVSEDLPKAEFVVTVDVFPLEKAKSDDFRG